MSLCDAPTPQDRRIGDAGVCKNMDPAGRIVLGRLRDAAKPVWTSAHVLRLLAGLYGQLVPQTVANFLATVRAGSFSGTVFNRVRVPATHDIQSTSSNTALCRWCQGHTSRQGGRAQHAEGRCRPRETCPATPRRCSPRPTGK